METRERVVGGTSYKRVEPGGAAEVAVAAASQNGPIGKESTRSGSGFLAYGNERASRHRPWYPNAAPLLDLEAPIRDTLSVTTDPFVFEFPNEFATCSSLRSIRVKHPRFFFFFLIKTRKLFSFFTDL